MSLYFCYDPDNGFETFDTPEKARAQCEEYFSSYQREASDDGWNELVDQLCWGQVTECVRVTKSTNRPPASEINEDGEDAEGNNWSNAFDAIEERAIVPNI